MSKYTRQEVTMIQENGTDNILERKELKENPFGVPSGYFSAMQEEVMAKISSIPMQATLQESSENKSSAGFMTYFKPAFALAAMFGIIFGLGYGAMKLTDTYTQNNEMVEAVGSEVPIPSQSDLSEDEIISILDITIEDIFASEESDETIEIIENSVNDEDIEQYLIDSRVSTISIALVE